jgi:hypothetical protein
MSRIEAPTTEFCEGIPELSGTFWRFENFSAAGFLFRKYVTGLEGIEKEWSQRGA